MKRYTSILALSVLFTAFTACEKSELDNLDTLDNQTTESFVNTPDLRVNDDSDQEDSGPTRNKNLSADDNLDLTEGSTSNGVDVSNSATSGGGNNNDDLVNDDSDDEEEGRRPNSNSPQPKGSE